MRTRFDIADFVRRGKAPSKTSSSSFGVRFHLKNATVAFRWPRLRPACFFRARATPRFELSAH
jgi:hypothetical protein